MFSLFDSLPRFIAEGLTSTWRRSGLQQHQQRRRTRLRLQSRRIIFDHAWRCGHLECEPVRCNGGRRFPANDKLTVFQMRHRVLWARFDSDDTVIRNVIDELRRLCGSVTEQSI